MKDESETQDTEETKAEAEIEWHKVQLEWHKQMIVVEQEAVKRLEASLEELVSK